MEKIKILFAHGIFRIVKWVFLILIAAFVVLVIVRAFYFYNLDKTNAQVEKIHATKLTLDDVMGKNLPPDPGEEADKTIAGIDANNNSIRDDVELAVFKEYPNSAKTRAVLLQYALALQMEVIQPIINQDIVTEVIREQSRGYECVSEILPRISLGEFIKRGDELRSFVEDRQINTLERKQQRKDFTEKIGSYNESENKVCDIDYLTLPN